MNKIYVKHYNDVIKKLYDDNTELAKYAIKRKKDNKTILDEIFNLMINKKNNNNLDLILSDYDQIKYILNCWKSGEYDI